MMSPFKHADKCDDAKKRLAVAKAGWRWPVHLLLSHCLFNIAGNGAAMRLSRMQAI
jgi:hypothetical protein